MNKNIEIAAKRSITFPVIIFSILIFALGIFVIIEGLSYLTGITLICFSIISIYIIYSETFNASIANGLIKVYGTFSKKIVIENFPVKDLIIKSFWTKQEVKKLVRKTGAYKYESFYPRIIFQVNNKKFEFRNATHDNFESLIKYFQDNLSEGIDMYKEGERQNEKKIEIKRVFIIFGFILLYFLLLMLEQKYFPK